MAKTVRKRVSKKKDEELVQCVSCGKFKLKSEFYISYNEMHKNGVLPYCKKCIQKMCNDKFNKIDRERTLRMLRTIDRPYIHSLYVKAAQKGGASAIGTYLRFINLQQHRDKKWLDGNLDMLDADLSEIKPTLTELKNVEPIKTEIEKFDDFEVDNDKIALFGTGYTDEEYFHMWNKYKFLSENYTEQTNMHTEALVTYVRYKVKEEMAVAAGKPSEAKTWGELAMKQAERAKINPNQFSKADLQGGLTTIGEIAQAVEQNVDIIPVLPQFKFRPNDAVDFCIWNYINYARDLEGKPLVEYKDVYKFYDKMREDYITSTGDPYGIFDDDPTLENREKVEQFIQLPDEYYEEDE
ncbi:MAG: hypothetical protein ACLTPN_02615 [Clostridia bacterium]|jgi:hypothetical protein